MYLLFIKLLKFYYIFSFDKVFVMFFPVEKIDILDKSFHTFMNYNFSQMFSYVKILDICEENITVTLHGKINEKLKNEILTKFM